MKNSLKNVIINNLIVMDENFDAKYLQSLGFYELIEIFGNKLGINGEQFLSYLKSYQTDLKPIDFHDEEFLMSLYMDEAFSPLTIYGYFSRIISSIDDEIRDCESELAINNEIINKTTNGFEKSETLHESAQLTKKEYQLLNEKNDYSAILNNVSRFIELDNELKRV